MGQKELKGQSGREQDQQTVCLPLIEEERRAYIKSQEGRLQGVMNTEYWDEDSGEYLTFHPLPELNPELGETGDPYDLTVEEIALLPSLTKRIERVMTYSFIRLFQMFPEDQSRMELLAELKNKLDLGISCEEEKVEELIRGHLPYLKHLNENKVLIIR